MLNRVKAVLFDAVGTLMRPCPAVGEAYAAAAARHGIVVAPEIVAGRFRQAFADEERFDQQTLAGRTSCQREVERWRRIVAQVFPEAADPAALFDDRAGFRFSWNLGGNGLSQRSNWEAERQAPDEEFRRWF